MVRTKNKTFGVDSIQCDIIDEIENEMLPDLVGGERTISFHLHIHKKYVTNLKYEVIIFTFLLILKVIFP